jgi:hypothetical protein
LANKRINLRTVWHIKKPVFLVCLVGRKTIDGNKNDEKHKEQLVEVGVERLSPVDGCPECVVCMYGYIALQEAR